MKNPTIDGIKRDIRHRLIDNHIMIETLLHSVLSNYFCDSEKTSREFLFLIMQKETSFRVKFEILENLKLYENKFITCSKRQYEKGLKNIKWLNDKRNKIAHNFVFLDYDKRKLLVNVVKSGNVTRLEINKGFLKELEKNISGALSFLGGLNLDIASHKGLIKDFKENFKRVK